MEISWKVSLPHSFDVLEIIEFFQKNWLSGGKITSKKLGSEEAGRLDIQRYRVARE
jgi:hypothetical protein